MLRREVKLLTRALSPIAGGLLAAALGLACLHYIGAEALARISFDLPFRWRAPIKTNEIVLVYLDDDSAKKLNQPLGEVWNRALHAELLERLTRDGARLVFYDIVFDAAAPDPLTDDALAAAIQRNGRVVLGAALDRDAPVGGVAQERILPPTRPLRRAAAGWGLLAFKPIDPDYAVRRLFTGTPELPTATWKAAELLGAKPVVAADSRIAAADRWVNYYGPPETFAAVNLAQALAPDGVPNEFFKDRIVMIGGRAVLGTVGLGKDEFATPYSTAGHGFSTGLEIHANILLNLLRGEWLTRLSPRAETFFVIGFGLLLGLLALMRPLHTTLVAIATLLLLAALAHWLVWDQRVWSNWLVPVTVQIPVALFWSLGAQYYLEARRRKELRRAFGFYLSPEMADKIANSDFDLTPGGRKVEATVMFTDLEGFTTLSEDLDPTEVSQTLIEYFERTTRCILEKKGTIIKYVGDAVMAGWGAPLAQPTHALLAAQAACNLRCLAEMHLRGHRLRTRIGLNTGPVLAGNLGSSYRFDYTMIGDTTNFASRLEALNKYLGTQVLISEATLLQLGDNFVTRPLGEFRVAGKLHTVSIHELICPCESESGERKWISLFEEALRLIRSADFTEGRARFAETKKLRGGADGPSDFYLKLITQKQDENCIDSWSGIVEMTEK
jgi:adenylate cyclase